MTGQPRLVNGHTITLRDGKYVVTHPQRGEVTRVPRGVGALVRAIKFAKAQR